MSSYKTLILCSTPLQSRIALELIRLNNLTSYDVIYLTKKNTNIHYIYYKKLADNAEHSKFIYNKMFMKGYNVLIDLLSAFRLEERFTSNSYKEIYISSIDNIFFRYLLKKNASATIYSFDDGTANITPSSIYFNHDKRLKSRIIDYFTNIPSSNIVRKSILKHFTIYENFENIVTPDKLEFINLFNFESSKFNSKLDRYKIITFFVGQPFSEDLSSKEINRLKEWLKEEKIDYYIKHPREDLPLLTNIPLFENQHLLTEEALWNFSKNNYIRLISAYSTLLFNINDPNIEKIYLSFRGKKNEQERRSLIKKTNSTIIDI